MLILFKHHINCYFLYFCAYLQSALGFSCFCLLSLFCLSFLLFSIMVRKIRAYRASTSSSSAPTFDSERFLSEKNQETYEKLNIRRNVSAERKVFSDELNGEIRRNFDHRG